VQVAPVVVVVHVLLDLDVQPPDGIHQLARPRDPDDDEVVDRDPQEIRNGGLGLLDPPVGVGGVDLVVADLLADQHLGVAGDGQHVQGAPLRVHADHEDGVRTGPLGVVDSPFVVVVVKTKTQDVHPGPALEGPFTGSPGERLIQATRAEEEALPPLFGQGLQVGKSADQGRERQGEGDQGEQNQAPCAGNPLPPRDSDLVLLGDADGAAALRDLHTGAVPIGIAGEQGGRRASRSGPAGFASLPGPSWEACRRGHYIRRRAVCKGNAGPEPGTLEGPAHATTSPGPALPERPQRDRAHPGRGRGGGPQGSGSWDESVLDEGP